MVKSLHENSTISLTEKYLSQREFLIQALQELLNDIKSYEQVNNLVPTPGRQDCWQSVTNAKSLLKEISE